DAYFAIARAQRRIVEDSCNTSECSLAFISQVGPLILVARECCPLLEDDADELTVGGVEREQATTVGSNTKLAEEILPRRFQVARACGAEKYENSHQRDE